MSSTDTIAEWLVPFKGRNHSGCYDQNFLWRTERVYLMDNHRAALWCWLRHVNDKEPHSIFHIDRHYDTLSSQMKTWLEAWPSEWPTNVEQYLSYSYDAGLDSDIPLFRFDNYLSLHLEKCRQQLTNCYFVTHQDGDKPDYDGAEVHPWELLESLEYWINNERGPWIMNIDLDYFFCDDAFDGQRRLMSDDYIVAVFGAVRKMLDDGRVSVATIAMSPEFCGGWQAAEEVLELVVSTLGFEFKLPA